MCIKSNWDIEALRKERLEKEVERELICRAIRFVEAQKPLDDADKTKLCEFMGKHSHKNYYYCQADKCEKENIVIDVGDYKLCNANLLVAYYVSKDVSK